MGTNDYCAYREDGRCRYPEASYSERRPPSVPTGTRSMKNPFGDEMWLWYFDRGGCPQALWPGQRACGFSMPRSDFKGS